MTTDEDMFACMLAGDLQCCMMADGPEHVQSGMRC